jgi:rhodanese-related sulfurtransferase
MEKPLQWHLTSSLQSQTNIIPVTANNITSYLKENPLIVDVRTQEEYSSGHLEGAKHIPVAEFSKRMDELEGRDVLLICRTGRRSTIAALSLFVEGYKGKVMELNKGLSTWGDKLELVK